MRAAKAGNRGISGGRLRMHIPEEQLEQVRAAANIVEVVSAHVPLKRRGQNHVGLCPFHNEKTPSFNVNETKQIFHCFGCGEGGNVFSFLMKMEGLDFPEAVRRLADRYGVVLSLREGRGAIRSRDERERVRRVNEQALARYRKALAGLAEGNAPTRYFAERGLDRETMERFELGWAPDAWDDLTGNLLRSGFSREDLLLAGVSVQGRQAGKLYDRFRGRLMFPIRTATGELAGFGGRALGDEMPKYLNSPETPLYRKGQMLYGLHPVLQGTRRPERVAVVEGYLDVIACHRNGIDWAVAPLGTALTESHVRLLARHTERVDLVFDGDPAGRAAARKAAALLAAVPLEVRVVTLPPGEDPDSLIRKEGAERVRARLTDGVPMMTFLFQECLGGLSGASIERRLAAAEPVLEVLARIPDVLRKGHYLGRLAEVLEVNEADVRRHFVLRNRPRPTVGERPAPTRREPPVPYGEGLLLHLVVQGLVDAAWLCERLSPEAFTDARARRVAQALRAAVTEGKGIGSLTDRLRNEPAVLRLVTMWSSSEALPEGDPAECAEACARDLERKEAREVNRRLLADIREAEARGETGRLMALLRQKDALTRTRPHIATG